MSHSAHHRQLLWGLGRHWGKRITGAHLTLPLNASRKTSPSASLGRPTFIRAGQSVYRERDFEQRQNTPVVEHRHRRSHTGRAEVASSRGAPRLHPHGAQRWQDKYPLRGSQLTPATCKLIRPERGRRTADVLVRTDDNVRSTTLKTSPRSPFWRFTRIMLRV